MSTLTPRYYAPLPLDFHRSRKVGLLRNEFGPVGPWAVTILLAEAEAHKQAGGARGYVEMSWLDLAYYSEATLEQAQRIVQRWADLTEIVDLKADELGFIARWRDWDKWQPLSGAVREAMRFLRDALEDGPRLSSEVQREAIEAGISKATLERARRELGIPASKTGGRGPWQMALPAKALKGSQEPRK